MSGSPSIAVKGWFADIDGFLKSQSLQSITRLGGAKESQDRGTQALQALRTYQLARPNALSGWGTFRLQLDKGDVFNDVGEQPLAFSVWGIGIAPKLLEVHRHGDEPLVDGGVEDELIALLDTLALLAGIGQYAELVVPIAFEHVGDEAIVGVDQHKAALGEIGVGLGALDRAAPQPVCLFVARLDLPAHFERQFDGQVNGYLLAEKMEKRLAGGGAPDHGAMRAGREALRRHLNMVETLLGVRNWIAGEHLSIGDFAAAAHLSVIDYFGDVPWRDFPLTKTWYTRLKCRPCFRPLLADRWPGMAPAADYDNLDF